MEKISKANKIKRILAFTIMLILALAIAGCGKDAGSNVNTSISNKSENTIENVRIISGTEQLDIGKVKPGESITLEVNYLEDGKINVKYTLNGFNFDSRLDADYKGAHLVDIIFGADNNGIDVFSVSTVKTISLIINWICGISLIVLIILGGILIAIRSKGVGFLRLHKAFKGKDK